MLWSSARPEEVVRMLPMDVLAFAAEREGKQVTDLPGFNVATFGQSQTAKFGQGPVPGKCLCVDDVSLFLYVHM